jgi:hypothetical protein
MEKIKTMAIALFRDRPRFFLGCLRLLLMILLLIGLYLPAFTAWNQAGDPNRFSVVDYGGIGSTIVLLWLALTIAFAVLTLLNDEKAFRIVAVVETAFVALYLGMILLTFAAVLDEIEGIADVSAALSFGFRFLLILIALIALSTFLPEPFAKAIARVMPANMMQVEPAKVVPAEEPESVIVEPVAPEPVASEPVAEPATPEPMAEPETPEAAAPDPVEEAEPVKEEESPKE